MIILHELTIGAFHIGAFLKVVYLILRCIPRWCLSDGSLVTSSQVPTAWNSLVARCASAAVAREPRLSAAAPSFTSAGVLGITRITRASDGRFWKWGLTHLI